MTERDVQLRFLNQALGATGLKPSRLAERAGLEPSTVTGFLSGRSQLLRESSLRKIAEAAELPIPPPEGFAEPEVTPFEGRLAEVETETVGDAFALVLQSDLMELEGLEPGDILFFDRRQRAEPGRIVCAQIYDSRQGTAETVVRLYQGAFLVARSRRRWEPQLVDNSRVVLIAPLIRQIRDRDWTNTA